MNEQPIFLAALEIADPAGADLTQACAGDPALLRQVETLLAAHERFGEFLDVPAFQQIAAVVSPPSQADSPAGPEKQRGPAETVAEKDDGKQEISLSFLQPASKPGSLGRLGHYEVQEVLRRGGYGIVLKAFDEKLHRVVAIKVMTPELAATSPARKRFLREAQAAAAIRHENVVSIHAVEDQPIPFLVMDYIAGQTLQQKLDQSGPFDVRDVVQIGHQIASGLEAAHAMGLIHRDIKPGNILLEYGKNSVKITDFGLARSADDASLTQSGVIAGTPLYMSPEQAQGDAIGQRSDLFSLGSVLYTMCTGRPPFRAATSVAVLKRVVEDDPRPIREIIPEIPEWLCALIAKLQSKQPSSRFDSAQQVAGLLACCLPDLQLHGRMESLGELLPMSPKPASAAAEAIPSERPGTAERLPRRHRWAAAAAVCVALLAGLGLTEATGVTNVRGTVIRLVSPDGTLVVEVDDPRVTVTVEGEDVVITGTGAKEIRLKPGQYKVLTRKDGKLVRQELVTVTTNGRQMVRVSRETDSTASTVSAAADRMAAYVNGGDWRLEGQEFVQTKPGKSLLTFGDPNWTDYDVSVETKTMPGPEKGQGGNLYFRVKTPNSHHCFSLGAYSGTYHEAFRMENGKWSRDGTLVKMPFETNRWYKAAVQVRGPRIRCWLDGQELFDFNDGHIPNGRIGLGTWNSAVRWKNLKVTSPAGDILFAGFPELSKPAAGPSRKAAE